jgi:hypothetical protein
MITLCPQNRDAYKNVFVMNYAKVFIYDIFSKHRDAFGSDFLAYVRKFDVNGYAMSYLFEPKNYVWIHVEIDALRKTVFVAELELFKDLKFSDFINSEVLIKYESTDGIVVW